jgi:RNA recognition motif-containing protein
VQRAVILYGLPPTFTVEALRALLSQFGTVEMVRVSPPDHSSFIIGYGEMKEREQARQVVKRLHGTMVGGQTLIVHRFHAAFE